MITIFLCESSSASCFVDVARLHTYLFSATDNLRSGNVLRSSNNILQNDLSSEIKNVLAFAVRCFLIPPEPCTYPALATQPSLQWAG